MLAVNGVVRIGADELERMVLERAMDTIDPSAGGTEDIPEGDIGIEYFRSGERVEVIVTFGIGTS